MVSVLMGFVRLSGLRFKASGFIYGCRAQDFMCPVLRVSGSMGLGLRVRVKGPHEALCRRPEAARRLSLKASHPPAGAALAPPLP